MRSIKLYQGLTVVLFFSVLLSCKKNMSGSGSSQTGNDTLYATGVLDSAGLVVLKYWVNGGAVNLPSTVATSSDLTTTGIAVSGTDVYVSGIDYNQSHNHVATYWKNGIPVHLGNDSADTYATGISISGSDIYVSGYQYKNGQFTPEYWKNGNLVVVDTSVNGYATCIAVSGSDVYLAGAVFTSGGTGATIAASWKDGNITIFGDSTTLGYTSSISVSGQDVYIAGTEYGSDASGYGYSTATYWKNGNGNFLTQIGFPSMGKSICISGSDVYVAGQETPTSQDALFVLYWNAAYWKNGNEVQLNPSPNAISYGATSISVSGNNIYVGGWQTLVTNPNQSGAVYWKNGVAATYNDGTTITAIYAKP